MKEYSYTVLGLMSGTSLDGIDIAICTFQEKKEKWAFDILFAKTYPYDADWKSRLKNAYNLNGRQLIELDRAYGDYLAQIITRAISDSSIYPDLVASHGQTIFHSPEKRMTCQIGHGSNISVGTRLPVVCDFRSSDLALGGQGAPLVPVGDKILFPEYSSCLNLGGFSNISFDVNHHRKAFDICPVNIALNDLAGRLGLDYDENGLSGRSGKVNKLLLEQLNTMEYYQRTIPKSLGYEWYESNILPLLNTEDISVSDKLSTLYYHIAHQISSVFKQYNIFNSLVTGGGTHNNYLIEIITSLSNTKLIIPEKNIIDFKEAIIFAFLGLMRFQNRINTWASVTGAQRDSTGGALYMP